MFESDPILSLAPIDTRNPVNRMHPLNRGRVAWWLCLPGLMGGRQLFDLTGLNPGTLTNMGNASNGWRGTTRPGGKAHLLFDGSAAYAPTTIAIAPSPAFTIAAWVNFGASGKFCIAGQCNGALSSCTFYARAATSVTTQNWGFTVAGSYKETTCPQVVAGAWSRCVWMYDGSLISSWGNGLIQFSSPASGTPDSSGTTTTLARDGNSNTNLFSGAMDDVTIWSRALSASEIQTDYNLSRQGYPGVLNRVPWWSYVNPSAAAKFRRTLYRRTGTRGVAA